MEYFKPMLTDKTLTMCQDVTPNTSEGKEMMYAITWNEAGTRMVQVGIKPVRLLEEVKQNEVSSVVENMPEKVTDNQLNEVTVNWQSPFFIPHIL